MAAPRHDSLSIPALPEGSAGLPGAGEESADLVISAMSLLNSYAHIFIAAFVVVLLAVPLVRKVAFAAGAVDQPDRKRKTHDAPVAYLGGLAVFLGLAVAIALSYTTGDRYSGIYDLVPMPVILGMVVIMITGLADDLWGWDPRLKIIGQLVAAAALALDQIGMRVAEGVLVPLLGEPEQVLLAIGSFQILNGFAFEMAGAALIGIFVLGGCNSANLIDGLDGLLSGVVAIVALGLLAIALIMVTQAPAEMGAGNLAGARIVLCLALLGAVLGFLPHNFAPASIFLGDCGSLLIGYTCAVIILMLGEQGQTHLVFAGLIIFAVPIMDTTLAIIRRWLAGTSMSAADDQHMHHQLRRTLGGVRRAVLSLYGISALFAIVGVSLAWLVMATAMRVRIIYAIALVLFSFIGVIAVKAARRQQRLAAQASAPAAARPMPVEEITRPSAAVSE